MNPLPAAPAAPDADSACPDPATIARHLDDPAGRYACYPGVAQFRPGFGDAGFVDALRVSNGDPIPAKLSIHIGVPDRFGLSAVDAAGEARSRRDAPPDAYLHRLVRQIAAVGALCDRDRDVVQLGLSPGATRCFGADEIAEIVDSLSRNFHFGGGAGRDFAATLAAEALTPAYLRRLVDAGCNRAGFAVGGEGVAAPAPGEAVARCRDAGFRNVRVDLLFGASDEDLDRFLTRLGDVVDAAPDVIAMRDIVHLPESFPPGRGGAHAAAMRAEMLCRAWRALSAAGFAHLGMGVFARAGDPLLCAKAEQRLHRDALGFGIHGATDLIGFGVGAIQQIGDAYCRALPHLREWEAAIDAGRLGMGAGLQLSEDDLLRAAVIRSIVCAGAVDFAAIANRHGIDPGVRFADALRALAPLAEDGLLLPDARGLACGFTLTPAGSLLSRVLASRFDAYLGQSAAPALPFAHPV